MGHVRNTMIFSTESGIVALDSPVKLKILELLRNGATSFDELVEQSDKAKSTISVHLDDLQELNLIQEKTFPNDKRKKYFVLNSICLAYSEPPLRRQYSEHLNNFTFPEANGEAFMTHLFHTVRFGMEAYGFDPRPIMKRLGNDVGIKIGQKFRADDFEGILNELSYFWKENKLGNMRIIRSGDPAILVSNCYHCGKMPNLGKTLCSMDEGIIEGVLAGRLNMRCSVKETECYGTGHSHCKFVVEKGGKTKK